jgi:hypothetical protein
MVNKFCSTIGMNDAAEANNLSYITHGDKSSTKTNEMTCRQYKPNISVFIRETDSIKDN